MANTLHSWKDCRDSAKVEKFARKAGCDVREAAGSHKVIRYKQMTETFYSGEISTGVACKLWKFFIKAGLIVAGIVAFVAVLL